MGRKGHVEVGYQSGKFVPLLNGDIDTMNKYQIYAEFFREG